MPSSTTWRQDRNIPAQCPPSPIRPTAIEAIPDADLNSHALDAHFERNDNPPDGNEIQGLGVYYDGQNENGNSFEGSPRLYADIDGQAHLTRTPPASRASYMNGNGGYDNYEDQRFLEDARHSSANKRKRAQGHTRSGSSIAELANVALADSSTFLNGSPNTPYPNRPATSHISNHGFSDMERPTKRVKSEWLPQTEWTSQEPRPATSHVAESRSLVSDAELLLALSRPLHFSPPQASLITQIPHYRSPHSFQTAHQHTANGVASEDSPQLANANWERHTNIINGTEMDTTRISPVHSEIPSQSKLAQSIEHPQHFGSAQAENLARIHRRMSPKSSVRSGSDTDRTNDRPKEPKKSRRVKPESQVSACAACDKLQIEPTKNTNGDENFANNWISCNGCEKWYHSACVDFKDKREVQSVDKFICKTCEPVHGATTYVRKSSRARTDIDYAGLNQGLIKSSAEISLHHYIPLIKDGTLKFQRDEFPRIRPEILTAEYVERTDGLLKRPFVVPAAWNPRFGQSSSVSKEEQPEEKEQQSENAVSMDGKLKMIPNLEAESQEEVIDCDQDILDMVMPRDLTVRKVAELYGSQATIGVINVKSQEQYKKQWTLQKWADYYERAGEKDVANVISLEVSESPMGRLIRRPKVVRDLDLQDAVWPADVPRKHVAFYCLMSVADSYTDFHIDFGGSSVYYHILKGQKTFFFIPPEDKNLKKYEDWCNSSSQNTTFLGDVTGDCIRVDLYPGDTAFIPSGWIHAVWTPEDSLVIGGNFLTRMSYGMQFKINDIERATKINAAFRYPRFQQVMWYSLIEYLNNDPAPQQLVDDFLDDPNHVFLRANPVWYQFGELTNITEPGEEEYNARFYPKTEIEGLPLLRDFLYRTALICNDMVPDVSKETSRRVRNSIPKGFGEPLDLIKRFGIWCAWKIGNVQAPEWTRSEEREPPLLPPATSKVAKAESTRLPPERQSTRVASLTAQTAAVPVVPTAEITPVKKPVQALASDQITTPSIRKPSSGTKTSGLGPKRVACEPCRKRRIKCRHKEESDLPSTPSASANVHRPRAVSNHSNDLSRPVTAQGISGTSGIERTPNLPAMDSQYSNSDPIQPTSAITDRSATPTDGAGASAGKKGRSKACEECRKSKRRCVHDEYGKVDPAKVAEPSKPRGSATAKRPARISDDLGSDSKRPRLDGGQSSSSNALDDLKTPSLKTDTALEQQSQTPALQDASTLMQSATDAFRLSTSSMTDSAAAPSSVPHAEAGSNKSNGKASSPSEMRIKTEYNPSASQGSLVSPPDSTGNHAEETDAVGDDAKPTTSPNGIGDPAANSMNTPSSASRHSSRQPKNVERFIPEIFKAKPSGSGGRRSDETQRRRSSSGASALTSGLSEKSRRSSSNTSGVVDALHNEAVKTEINPIIGAADRAGSTDSVAVIEDADERYARELQAQENGLRRRSGRS